VSGPSAFHKRKGYPVLEKEKKSKPRGRIWFRDATGFGDFGVRETLLQKGQFLSGRSIGRVPGILEKLVTGTCQSDDPQHVRNPSDRCKTSTRVRGHAA